MGSDERLREDRLVFYREDMERIQAVLREFLELSRSVCAMLIDKDGHLITQAGHTQSYHPDTISALVAGSFAATREMARLLGEDEFSILFHQGKRESIQLALAGNRTLVAIVFDDTTTLGLVRLYSEQMVAKLEETFQQAQQSQHEHHDTLEAGFNNIASENLDGVFGS